MSKQDRQGARTPADLDRRYNLGGIRENVNSVIEFSGEVRQEFSKMSAQIRQELNTKLEGYVEDADLEEYAKVTDLDGYAKTSDLDVFVEEEEFTDAVTGIEANVAKNGQAITAIKTGLGSATQTANEALVTANGVANDVNDHFEFADGGTRIKGVFNALFLEQDTDLDGVILPNKYTGGDVADFAYLNCPITSGSFSLVVEACGEEGQLLQRLSYGHKTNGKTFERVYDNGWGNWICVTDYTGAALAAVQNEVDALGVAFGEFLTNSAASAAETDDDIAAVGSRVDALGVRTQNLERSVQAANVDLQGVITDINDHFDFVEGGTAIKGGLMPMVLPSGTDLDGVTIPKKYTSETVANGNYPNSPITSGTFALEVEYCGNEGQILQRLTYSHKTNGKTFERILYQGEWGAWVVVTDYTGSALKAVQNEVDTLEAALNTYKTEAATRMTKAESNISTISSNVTAVGGKVQNLNTSVQSMSADLQGVINDVNDHFDFNEGGMTIKGAINPMLIPAGTDLNGLIIPNKYIGGVVTEYTYLNCPITSGTFSLDIDSCGNGGQIKQRLTYSNKTNSKTYERFYYADGAGGAFSWGAWVIVTDFVPEDAPGKLLWADGVYYMTANQTVNLAETVSAQKNGIILVFSEYLNGAASDTSFHGFFVHKKQVAQQPGKSYVFTLATSKLDYVGTKNVFIEDTRITGHADNNATGTGISGIKYTNNRFVLRYVIGF